MIFTDLYRLQHISSRSKLRLDSIAKVGSYLPFEALKGKNGNVYMYLGKYGHGNKDLIKPDLALTHTDHISGLYIPDIEITWAHGDVKGTRDAIIVSLDGYNPTGGNMLGNDYIDVFIARGQAKNQRNIWQQVVDGELDDEIAALKKRLEGGMQ